MDTQDYLEIKVNVANEEIGDIIAATAGELGFDAFLYEDGVQKCYIQSELFSRDAFAACLEELAPTLGCNLPFTVEKMPVEDWNSTWEKEGFTPIECGGYVVMPWGGETLPADDGREPIYLDPKMAFGTGHHQTTYMMMETMQALAGRIAGAAVTDLGCGTAVLAILAARLGAGSVLGIDIDAVAARSATENVRINSLDFPIVCGDASALEPESCDVLLANIHRNIIIADFPLYARAVRRGGIVLLSGFYTDDREDVLAAALKQGFVPAGSRERDGWCCLAVGRR